MPPLPDTPSRRVLDLLVGVLLSIVTVPIIIVCAVTSAITYRSSPFFVHERIGRSGRPFKMVKIRTLPPATLSYVEKYDLNTAALPWAALRMRRMHLDELPQLWHVVAGTMTLFGPRPEMENLHDRLAPEFQAMRTAVRPGVTGLWQVSDHCHQLIAERPEYDLFYLSNRSWTFDLWVAWATMRKLFGRGTVGLLDIPSWVGLRTKTLTPSLTGTSAAGD